jgi:hypothetical protein
MGKNAPEVWIQDPMAICRVPIALYICLAQPPHTSTLMAHVFHRLITIISPAFQSFWVADQKHARRIGGTPRIKKDL